MTCPECSSERIVPRVSGFSACADCGKLIVAPIAGQSGEGARIVPLAEREVVVPDVTEALTGWRAWGVRRDVADGEVPLLKSVTYGDHWWTPREPMEAVCPRHAKSRRRAATEHAIPEETCSCGLYSAKTREHLVSMSYHRYDAESSGLYHVMGEVALWGKVIEGSQGWRAQYGYPRKLYVPYEAWRLADRLRQAYGCEVSLDNILKPITAKGK